MRVPSTYDLNLVEEVERKPWERQKGESPKQYEAFVVYRDMGNQRGLRETAKRCQKHLRTVGQWSVDFEWPGRVAAWLDEQDRVRRQQTLEEIEEMNGRQVRMALMGQNAVIQRLRSLQENANALSPAQLANLMKASVEIERLARGQNTQQVAVETKETEVGRISRAILDSPEATQRALAMLDDVADAEAKQRQPQ